VCLCVLDTTLCDKVCQWLVAGRCFSPGTPVSSTNKTYRREITQILLKVVLITITLTLSWSKTYTASMFHQNYGKQTDHEKYHVKNRFIFHMIFMKSIVLPKIITMNIMLARICFAMEYIYFSFWVQHYSMISFRHSRPWYIYARSKYIYIFFFFYHFPIWKYIVLTCSELIYGAISSLKYLHKINEW
jgi:hypothetical protein